MLITLQIKWTDNKLSNGVSFSHVVGGSIIFFIADDLSLNNDLIKRNCYQSPNKRWIHPGYYNYVGYTSPLESYHVTVCVLTLWSVCLIGNCSCGFNQPYLQISTLVLHFTQLTWRWIIIYKWYTCIVYVFSTIKMFDTFQ